MFRGLSRSKGYSLLNITGLAIGITSAALIFLWAEDELNYDAVFPNKDYIYNIPTNQDYNGKIYTFNATPGILIPTLKEEVPGIEYATRFNESTQLMSVNDKALYKSGAYVDLDFFKMFSLHFIAGSIDNLANDINAIAITQKTANQLFGTDKNLVGKSIVLNNGQAHSVGGVIEDLPENVSLKFDWLGNYKAFEKGKEFLKMWGSNSTASYVQLNKNADVAAIDSEVRKVIPKNKGGEESIYGFLDSMKNWHLYSHKNGEKVVGQIVYVRLMMWIALIILIIACINFMNLATARSTKRAGEVGIRKVLGSKRKQLIVQFITEALIITSVAAIISIILLYLSLPYFNSIIGKDLTVGLGNPIHIATLVGIVLCCGVLAGSYPAFYLSSFIPAIVLKGGRSKKGGAAFIRNGLVVIQFSASIVLIIATIIIYSQIQYVKNRDIGFNRSNLVAIDLQGEAAKSSNAIEKEMADSHMVKNAGVISYNLMHGGWNGSGFEWEGKPEDFNPLISFRSIDAGFIPSVGMEIVEGRNFYDNPVQDGYGDSLASNFKVIITQSFADMLGKGSAIGKIIRNSDETYEVAGVVKNVQYGSMYSKSDPILFFNNPQMASLLYARINENAPRDKALSSLEAIMRKFSPAFPFEYKFVEDTFNAKFRSEQFLERLAKWFAFIAILISCFGLFGLAAYTAEQRNKEIGIRKVLGASIGNVVHLLSSDFLKLVLIAIVLAIPLAWILMGNWLEKFSYRVSLSWWMFGLAALLALVIALATVSFQSIKAALTNPTKSLRNE